MTPLPGDPVAERFGRNLRRHRKLADLSQEEVGWRASVHHTEVSQLERALRIPRLDTVVKLAGALEVEPGDLLDGLAWVPAERIVGGRFRSQADNEPATHSPAGDGK